MTADLRPVCFIAMPFNRKHTGADRQGAPSEVDFDALLPLKPAETLG